MDAPQPPPLTRLWPDANGGGGVADAPLEALRASRCPRSASLRMAECR
jgi:hypothetical protein